MRKLLSAVLLAVVTFEAGAADVTELTKKLGSKDNEVRRAAARELGDLGKEAKPAVKALIKALQDEDRFVRRFAAQALGSIGPEAREAVNPLAKLIDDDKAQVRDAAVRALAKLGPSAVPALRKALSGPGDVQEVAIGALGEAGKAGIPGLTAAIQDSKMAAALRRRAIEVLVPLGNEARSALPALTQVVQKPAAGGQQGTQLRVDAINALGRLARSSDRAAVTALDEIVRDEKLRNNQVKNAAKRALSQVKKRK